MRTDFCLRRLVLSLAHVIAAVALPAGATQSAGVTSPGTTAYANGGMIRLSKVILSSANYSSMYGAAIDAGNGFGYFTSAGAINPGHVVKVDLSGPVPVELGAAHCQTGELNLLAAVADPSAGFGYFGTTTSPGRVIKIALGSGTNAPSYLTSFALNSGENSDWTALIDDSDPNPANHYAYFGCGSTTGRVVKVSLGTFQEIGGVTLLPNESISRRAAIDTVNGYAYFAGPGGGAFAIPTVVKVALGAGTNPPVRVGAAALDSVFNGIGGGVIDVVHGYAYFGVYRTNVPAKVYKVSLGAGNNPPALAQTLTMGAGTRELSSSVIDPVAGCALFGTDHVHPAKVHKVKLGAGNAMPTDAGFLQLMPGTCATNVPSCYPPDGGNLLNTNPAMYGELYLQSALIDPGRGYAWFGCDSHPGQVVKIAYSQKALIKGTRLVLNETAYVTDARFYSHAAAGNVRLAIYDNAAPKNLVWQSGSVPNTASNAWLTVPVFSGSPASLTLGPGTYWLAWQVDTTMEVASYVAGVSGEGFYFNQEYGAFPGALSGATNSVERWSLFITYNTSPPPPPRFSDFGFAPSGDFKLRLAAAPDYPFRLQASTNLVDWIFIDGALSGTNGQVDLLDPDAGSFPHRFYRSTSP